MWEAYHTKIAGINLTFKRFLFDGTFTFEVGGKSKTFKQIADLPDSYTIMDDVETGHGHRIPLWMFGLLY